MIDWRLSELKANGIGWGMKRWLVCLPFFEWIRGGSQPQRSAKRKRTKTRNQPLISFNNKRKGVKQFHSTWAAVHLWWMEWIEGNWWTERRGKRNLFLLASRMAFPQWKTRIYECFEWRELAASSSLLSLSGAAGFLLFNQRRRATQLQFIFSLNSTKKEKMSWWVDGSELNEAAPFSFIVVGYGLRPSAAHHSISSTLLIPLQLLAQLN